MLSYKDPLSDKPYNALRRSRVYYRSLNVSSRVLGCIKLSQLSCHYEKLLSSSGTVPIIIQALYLGSSQERPGSCPNASWYSRTRACPQCRTVRPTEGGPGNILGSL